METGAKLVATFLVAMIATGLIIQTLRPVASRFDLVDRPAGRKDHKGDIPLVGGISIYLGFTLSLLFVGMLVPLTVFLLVGGVLMVVGAADDAAELSPLLRLLLHIGCVVVMSVFGGVAVTGLGEIIMPGVTVDLGLLAIPFTVFATVALINAVNMSDGLDGLAGSQTLISFAGLAFIAAIKGDFAHMFPLLAICGCLVGFLFFNFRAPWRKSATVFLGDAGSNFLGFAMAWFLIDMSQGPQAVLTPTSVLWFALLIIYSTVEIVSRRVLRRRSPFKPDREHLHHAFILAGFSVPQTVGSLAGVTLLGVIVGIVGIVYEIPENIMFGTFVIFGIVFLRVIFKSWSAMQFLYRSICRRRGERRKAPASSWGEAERRILEDRRKDQG